MPAKWRVQAWTIGCEAGQATVRCCRKYTANTIPSGLAMRLCIALMMTLLLLGIAGCCSKAGSPSVDHGWDDLEGVWVEYDYAGQNFYNETFTVERKGAEAGFVMHADILAKISEHAYQRQELTHTVPNKHVKLLLDALVAPAWTREQGTQAMRAKLAPSSVQLDRALMSSWRCDARGEQASDAVFSSKKARQSLIDGHYENFYSWTDDYPLITIQLRWEGKPGMAVISRSQKAMMLPWETARLTGPTDQLNQNWSLELSQAIAGLLPPDSRAYERLTNLQTHLRYLHFDAEFEAARACADR